MELRKAIMERRSIRGFKDTPVARETIEDVLRMATRAVSANNIQPWEFAVITGDLMKKIGAENVEAFLNNEPEDYEEEPFEGIFRRRQIEIGKQLLTEMEVAREDKEKRLWWAQRGFRFFDAPAVIILYMDSSLDQAACRLEMGCVAQNICLAAMEHGLGTCVENQAINYQKALRRELGISDDKCFVTGIAIGYPDWDFPANNVISTRVDISENTKWFGFDK